MAPTGSKCVAVKTTGHDKDQFTVILTAGRADGKKTKPFVVFKRKGTRLIKELQTIPGIIVQFSGNEWMNDELTSLYLKSVIGSLSFQKRIMIWDAYKFHTSEATRKELERLKIHHAVVPEGCTKFIQAADVVWNSISKAKRMGEWVMELRTLRAWNLRRYYDLWLSGPACHLYTKGGNLKPPSYTLLCQWVKSA